MKKQEILFTPMKAKPGEEVGFYFGRFAAFVQIVKDSKRKRVTITRKRKKGGAA